PGAARRRAAPGACAAAARPAARRRGLRVDRGCRTRVPKGGCNTAYFVCIGPGAYERRISGPRDPARVPKIGPKRTISPATAGEAARPPQQAASSVFAACWRLSYCLPHSVPHSRNDSLDGLRLLAVGAVLA